MNFIGILIIVIVIAVQKYVRNEYRKERKEYYHEYLKSDDWQIKRYIVLKRDNYKCIYCGAPATQVHHIKYAKYQIGKEPIDWLVSVCSECHKMNHN